MSYFVIALTVYENDKRNSAEIGSLAFGDNKTRSWRAFAKSVCCEYTDFCERRGFVSAENVAKIKERLANWQSETWYKYLYHYELGRSCKSWEETGITYDPDFHKELVEFIDKGTGKYWVWGEC